MKKYGLRIGRLGLEFADKTSRDKALLVFIGCSVVEVNDSYGLVYKESGGSSAFSVYERETQEVMMRCSKCDGVFSSESCSNRPVPSCDWNGKLKEKAITEDETENKCMCDGCETKIRADLKREQAKRVLGEQAA